MSIFRSSCTAMNQKGFAPIFVLFGILLLLVAGGAYYFGSLKNATPTNSYQTFSPKPDISPTVKFTDSTASASPASAKVLIYNLPTGWKTISDISQTVQVGYDPAIDAAVGNQSIIDVSGTWQTNPAKKLGYDYNLTRVEYNGVTKERLLYRELGISGNESNWKGRNFHTQEYTYNGWPCLAFYDVSVSQYNSNWVTCITQDSRAFLLTVNADQAVTEQILGTVKLLK